MQDPHNFAHAEELVRQAHVQTRVIDTSPNAQARRYTPATERPEGNRKQRRAADAKAHQRG